MLKQYDIKIKDPKQPLLISNPTKQEERMGKTTPSALVPELCSLTGLSDEQRADVRLMKVIN